MFKLYKQSEQDLLYWEAWVFNHTVTTHTGKVGFRGKLKEYKLTEKSHSKKFIERLAKKPRRKGFIEIAHDDHWTLTIQQKMTEDIASDLEHRNELIDGLDEMLGWIGAGHVDGGDIGSGTTNVFAFVLAPTHTGNAVLAWLEQIGELTNSTVAITEPGDSGTTVVIWPSDFEGDFSILGN